jgi:hypothetical protein
VDGETYDPQARRPLVEYSYVSPGYIDAMGIALLSGRKLEERDATHADVATGRVALVNQAFVDRYWPGESGLGKRVRQNGDPPEWIATVVGVVADVRQWGLEYPPLPEMYFPHSAELWSYTRLVVRAAGDPQALVPALRQAVREIDSQIPFSGVRSMDDVVTRANERRRFYTLLVTLFAVTALILVVAGTYGVMSYYVSRRTHEVGVRVALGADSGKVMGLFLRQAGGSWVGHRARRVDPVGKSDVKPGLRYQSLQSSVLGRRGAHHDVGCPCRRHRARAAGDPGRPQPSAESGVAPARTWTVDPASLRFEIDGPPPTAESADRQL